MSPAQGHITAAPRLTSHLRALSLIAPIQKLEDTKGLLHTQGQSAEHVDLRYLALAAIELLIERMGAGGTASRVDLLDYLASLATIQWNSISPDDAATLAEHVFDGLTNARDRRARFAAAASTRAGPPSGLPSRVPRALGTNRAAATSHVVGSNVGGSESWGRLSAAFEWDKAVPDPSQSLDSLRIARIPLNLLAQPSHMHVNRPRIDGVIITPHSAKETLS